MKTGGTLLATLIVAAAIWTHGHSVGVDSEKGRVAEVEAEQLRQAFEQGREFGTVRDRVVTEYVDRVQVIEQAGKTIIKEVPVYVSEAADRACPVPAGFVRLHDAAAAGLPPPGRAGATDAAPSGVALSAVAGTVAGNYSSCNANAEQLSQLQELLVKYQSIVQGRQHDQQ